MYLQREQFFFILSVSLNNIYEPLINTCIHLKQATKIWKKLPEKENLKQYKVKEQIESKTSETLKSLVNSPLTCTIMVSL